MMEQLLPKLRFPEFKEEWKIKKISELGTIVTGTTPSTSNASYYGGSNLFLSPADINENRFVYDTKTKLTDLGFTKTRILKSNSVAFVCIGSTIGKIAQVKKEFSTNQQINSIEFKSGFSEAFNYYNLLKKSKEIRLLASVQTVPQINKTDFSKIKLSVPSLEEQTKIADFLGAVDKQLDILNQKKEKLNTYKKGVMQQLFSQQLRFKDDNGNDFPEWEEKTLGEIGNSFNGLTGKTAKDFGEGKKYIQYKQIFDKPYIDFNDCGFVNIIENEKQNECKIGDVFFTVSSETKEEIAMSSVIESSVDFPVYLNSFCFGIRFKENVLIPKFSRFYFRNEIFRKSVIVLAQGSTRFNLSKVNFMKLAITIPSIEEQTKIANFLSAIDNQIQAVENQITKNETYKKGLLQQMFV